MVMMRPDNAQVITTQAPFCNALPLGAVQKAEMHFE